MQIQVNARNVYHVQDVAQAIGKAGGVQALVALLAAGPCTACVTAAALATPCILGRSDNNMVGDGVRCPVYNCHHSPLCMTMCVHVVPTHSLSTHTALLSKAPWHHQAHVIGSRRGCKSAHMCCSSTSHHQHCCRPPVHHVTHAAHRYFKDTAACSCTCFLVDNTIFVHTFLSLYRMKMHLNLHLKHL